MKTQDFVWETMSAGGIFGRYKNATVTFKGEDAYTDGENIVLPALPSDIELTNEQVRAMRGFLDHEAGHLRHSDFKALEDFAKRAQHNGHHGLKELWNAFEDIWMERKVMDEYLGSEKNLNGTWNFCSTKQLAQVKEKGTPESKLGQAMLGITNIGRHGYAKDNYEELMTYLPESMRDNCKKWTDEIHKCKNTQDVIDFTKYVYNLLKEEQENNQQSDPEQFDGEDAMEQGGQMDLGDLPEESDQEGEEAREYNVTFGSKKDGEDKKIDKEDEVDAKIPGFSPWDGDHSLNYRVLSTENDEIFSRTSVNKRTSRGSNKLATTPPSEYDKMQAGLQSHVNVMRNKLKRSMMAKQQRDWDMGRELGRLDTKRLVSAYAGSRNVFKQRIDREDLDTAVNLLVDLSGSMTGEKVRLANETVVAFCECLEGTGIDYQVSGWNTGGPTPSAYHDIKAGDIYHRVEPNNYYLFKGFDESLRLARGSVAAIQHTAGNCNADRCAIEWAAHDLMKRKQTRKILLVFSDGQPACSTTGLGYDSLRKTLPIGINNVRKKGVQTVGIGIMSDSVEGLYDHYAVVNNLDELSGVVFNQLSKVILDGRI